MHPLQHLVNLSISINVISTINTLACTGSWSEKTCMTEVTMTSTHAAGWRLPSITCRYSARTFSSSSARDMDRWMEGVAALRGERRGALVSGKPSKDSSRTSLLRRRISCVRLGAERRCFSTRPEDSARRRYLSANLHTHWANPTFNMADQSVNFGLNMEVLPLEFIIDSRSQNHPENEPANHKYSQSQLRPTVPQQISPTIIKAQAAVFRPTHDYGPFGRLPFPKWWHSKTSTLHIKPELEKHLECCPGTCALDSHSLEPHRIKDAASKYRGTRGIETNKIMES